MLGDPLPKGGTPGRQTRRRDPLGQPLGGAQFRFRAAGGIHAGPGSAGSLIPPHEFHTIRNASQDAVAISLHIYQAPMENCAKFFPRDGEWFERETCAMCTDEVA